MDLDTRVYPPAWAPIRTLGLLALMAGCGHSEPFGSTPYGSDAPFSPSPPVRLTFNPLADRGAAWLPDGSGILYSAQQEGRSDHDVCLAQLPPSGGRQLRLDCDLTGHGVDSINAIESPAPAADGRLAFVEASGDPDAVIPNTAALAVAPSLDPHGGVSVRSIPYAIPGEPIHVVAQQLKWLDAGHLIYVAGSRTYNTMTHDTVISNLAVALFDLATGGLPAVVPGTTYASGVSAGTQAGEIWYTLGGDTRVYRRVMATGEVTVVHDFGPAGIARDIQISGNRMTAVVGGRVAFVNDPALGPTQFDSGGVVHVVDLTTGGDQAVDAPGLMFRRPALSPAGDRVAVEGYPLIRLGSDTIVIRTGDLYLMGAP
jgi:hypothetical protein